MCAKNLKATNLTHLIAFKEPLPKGGFIVTAGLSLADFLVFSDDIESKSAFQMGLQFNPKKSLFQIAFYARPLRYYNMQRLENFNSIGTNAELTLTVKKVTYGRLTRLVKNGYLGLEYNLAPDATLTRKRYSARVCER